MNDVKMISFAKQNSKMNQQIFAANYCKDGKVSK